jgi:phosphoglycerol transferase MdoB-like AlkP superfamily enzyme
MSKKNLIDEISDKSNISIISMNLTEKKYYIYGTNGILENRVDYEELDTLYGSPVSTSSSG